MKFTETEDMLILENRNVDETLFDIIIYKILQTFDTEEAVIKFDPYKT